MVPPRPSTWVSRPTATTIISCSKIFVSLLKDTSGTNAQSSAAISFDAAPHQNGYFRLHGLRGEARDRIFEPRTIAGFGIQRDMITGNALLFRLVTLMAQFALECIQPSERGLHYRCTFGSGSAGMIESLFGDPADFV